MGGELSSGSGAYLKGGCAEERLASKHWALTHDPNVYVGWIAFQPFLAPQIALRRRLRSASEVPRVADPQKMSCHRLIGLAVIATSN